MSNIISGERFQQICDVGVYLERSCIINNQIKSLYQNILCIKDIDEISNYKKIFIYSHDVHAFMDKFINNLSNDTIIITHNSDVGIDNSYASYLESSRIKKWYCQNRYIAHDKLSSIPIGIGNSQWAHGNQSLLKNIRDNNYIKDNIVYKNFDINTNYSARNICQQITHRNGILFNNNTDIPTYWSSLARSCFVISPPGNGVDCHRIWEALFLKCVPVVLYHECFSEFKNLPILFVDSWEYVTLDFLKNNISKYAEMFNSDIPQLTTEYWIKKINNI
jgi:hypothetical protein